MRPGIIVGVVLALLVLTTVRCGGSGGGASSPTTSVQPASETPAQTASRFSDVGPNAVWTPALAEVLNCGLPQRTKCVTEDMRRSGASPEAIHFFETTGWFLTDFKEQGKVDLGYLVDPFRANSNYDFALLNGTPAFVVAEQIGGWVDGAVRLDPTYGLLVNSFPQLTVSMADEAFEQVATLPDGSGQRFIFQYALNGGCHACLTGYAARATFDFASDGTLQGVQPDRGNPGVLGVCRSTALPVKTVIQSLPECPPVQGPVDPFRSEPTSSR